MKRMRPTLLLAFLTAQLTFASAWTDRSEYDLVLKVHAEASPEKQIALLDEWKAKYPKTDMKQARLELYLSAYRAEGDPNHMMTVAKEMLAGDSGNKVGLYWAALLIPSVKDVSPETLALSSSSAQRIATDPALGFVAHRALGWVAWRQNKLPDAETELTAAAKLDPQNAEISEWLGTVLVQENDSSKTPAAVWQLARAASLKGDRALPESERGQVLTALERLYKRENGDLTGLDQIKVDAAAAQFPPATFGIGPLATASATDSSLNAPIWALLKARLAATDAPVYFDQVLKGKTMPPFKARVLRCTPPGKPTQVFLSLTDAGSEDVLLSLNSPLPSGAKPGTQIEFTGTASAFNPDPFLLTVTADPDALTGWPDAPARRSAKH